MADRKHPIEIENIVRLLHEEYFTSRYEREYGQEIPFDSVGAKRYRKRHEAEFSWPAVMARVADYYKGCKSLHQTYLVCMTSMRRGGDEFNAVQFLGPVGLEYIRIGLGVPPGAWEWAAWADKLPEGKIKRSVEYWLGQWSDLYGEKMLTPAQESKFKSMLIKLVRESEKDEYVDEDEVEEVDEI